MLRSATICRPFRSKRAMISPDSPRANASGFTRINVRSMGSFAGWWSRWPVGKRYKDAVSEVCWPIGDPVDLRSVHERARTPPIVDRPAPLNGHLGARPRATAGARARTAAAGARRRLRGRHGSRSRVLLVAEILRAGSIGGRLQFLALARRLRARRLGPARADVGLLVLHRGRSRSRRAPARASRGRGRSHLGLAVRTDRPSLIQWSRAVGTALLELAQAARTAHEVALDAVVAVRAQ